jgi:hypothetical protein
MRSRRLSEGVRVRQLLLSSEELGESAVLPTLAILTSAALYATLRGRGKQPARSAAVLTRSSGPTTISTVSAASGSGAAGDPRRSGAAFF